MNIETIANSDEFFTLNPESTTTPVLSGLLMDYKPSKLVRLEPCGVILDIEFPCTVELWSGGRACPQCEHKGTRRMGWEFDNEFRCPKCDMIWEENTLYFKIIVPLEEKSEVVEPPMEPPANITPPLEGHKQTNSFDLFSGTSWGANPTGPGTIR